MERRLDELWMEAVELQVDRLVVGYLRKSHADYQNMQKRQWDLLDQYPVLNELIDSADEIKLNPEEHRALRELIQIQDGVSVGRFSPFRGCGHFLGPLIFRCHPVYHAAISPRLCRY